MTILKLATTNIVETETDSIVVGHLEGVGLQGSAKAIDEATGGVISDLIASGDLGHKHGKIRTLYDLPGIAARRVMVVGCGPEEKFRQRKYVSAVESAVNRMLTGPVQRTTICLAELPVVDKDAHWRLRHAGIAAGRATYIYTETKDRPEHTGLEEISLTGGGEAADLETATAIFEGMHRTMQLGNLPPNICTPAYLADQAAEIAQNIPGVSVEVLEPKQLETLGMRALLAVGKGSVNTARLIILKYNGAGGDAKPHVLVGKGITFDTGGISLKPGKSMHEMKYDMCGAASVIGAFQAVASRGLKINLITVVAAAENMPDANAYRPGDVIKSMSGQTIEVLNTDAEGRMVLCDALTYVERFDPASVIDVATLTGACVVALGKHATGLLSKTDDLAESLLAAGIEASDKAWRLPLWDEYQSQIDTDYADMANVGGPGAGTITAACFLSRFTKKYAWAHLDIAGTAWDSGSKTRATGRPVGLLVQYLMNQSSN